MPRSRVLHLHKIFLADDSSADGLLMRMAFADALLIVEVVQVFSGVEACATLLNAAQTPPFPYSMIVLDLNMPKMTGIELLEKLNVLPILADIPKIVLTSSTNPRDQERAMVHHPTLYLTKPYDYHGMISLVKGFIPMLKVPETPTATA